MTVDPCKNRHGGDPQSAEAWARCNASAMRDRIIKHFQEGWSGTSKEFAAMIGTQLNCISGRFSELRRRGLLRKTGVVRDGAAELEFAA